MLKLQLDVLKQRSGEAINAAMIKQNGLLDLLKVIPQTLTFWRGGYSCTRSALAYR